MPLFETRARYDREIRRSGENTFRFLDRVDDVYFGRVRDLLNEWFDHVPTAEQANFRRRFQTSDEPPGDPAFFELYLHEALRRAGFALTYEPSLPDSPKRPDYLATGRGHSFFLEAKLVGEARERVASDKRRYAAIEPLRKITSRDFTIDLGIVREGLSAPPVGHLRPKVEAWLASLDREDVNASAKQGLRHVPRLVLAAGDWEFSFRPIPKPEHRVGTMSPAGSISIFPGRTAWGGEWGRLSSALKEKARRYGKLDRPFVIAVLVGGAFVDTEEIASAIYGDPVFAMRDDRRGGIAATPGRSRGLWSNGGNSRVSAVLVARHLVPASVNQTVPTLWRNDAARYPFQAEMPFAADARLAPSGEIEIGDPKRQPAPFFDLPPAWPGPERPFR